MLNLIELEQFVAFEEYGTLSKVAEVLHISQPTITRTMHHVEEAFGVPLFERGKNKIILNETGRKAVEYAKKVLSEAENAVLRVQEYDQKLHTIHVESCAPAPLWSLLPELSVRHPGKTISSKLTPIEEIIKDVENKKCDMGVIPYEYSGELKILEQRPILREKLSVCVPKNHALANHETLTFEQINGFNCLLKDQIGFWTELCYEKMPASKFLIQTNEFDFEELVRTSTLLSFVTDVVSDRSDAYADKKIIPIINPEADVTYYLIKRRDNHVIEIVPKQ